MKRLVLFMGLIGCGVGSNDATLDGKSVGQLEGYERIENILRARLFKEVKKREEIPENLELFKKLAAIDVDSRTPEEKVTYNQLKADLTIRPGFVLAGVFGDFKPQQTGIAQLMGTRFYPTVITLPVASNHTAHALNVFTWDLVLSELANKVSYTCDQVKNGDKKLTVRIEDKTMKFAEFRTRDIAFNDIMAAILRDLCQTDLKQKPFNQIAEDLFLQVSGSRFSDAEQTAWLEKFQTKAAKDAPRKETIVTMLRTIFLNPYFLLKS